MPKIALRRGCLLAVILGCCAGPALAAELARPADSFVETVGVNTHSSFPGNSYDQDWNRVIQAVGQIGFRYIRDLPDRPDRLNALTTATGAKVIAIAQDGPTRFGDMDPSLYSTVLNRLKQVNGLAYIEWPNEPEATGDPNWQNTLRAWVQPLYADAKADPFLKTRPVVATTSFDPASISDLGAYCDLGNMHSYPGGGLPTRYLSNSIARSEPISGSKPRLATETGYLTMPSFGGAESSYGVSEAAQAKYTPRLLLDYFNAGVVHTLPYELMDERPEATPTLYENHFGLIRADFTWKPAAGAVKNLLALLADPGSGFTPASLEYTLSGGGSSLHHTLLQKRDGTFWLALWQDATVFDWQTQGDIAVGDVAVTLGLGSQAAIARTYLPGQSDIATASFPQASQLDLMVPAEVMLVQIDFAGVTVPEPSCLAAVLIIPLLARRRRPVRSSPASSCAP